jgi:hypothetical protein
MLGIPDAAYQQWVVRFDLHDIAMFGRGHVDRDDHVATKVREPIQEDRVIVTPKRRNYEEGTG